MGEKRTHRFLSVVGVPSIFWETEAILAGQLRILSPIGAVDDESIVSCLLTQRLVQHKLLSRRQRWLESSLPTIFHTSVGIFSSRAPPSCIARLPSFRRCAISLNARMGPAISLCVRAAIARSTERSRTP
jgi:hypothetical protein